MNGFGVGRCTVFIYHMTLSSIPKFINYTYILADILASASPVWRKMFTSDFQEKGAQEIPLPGKTFNEIHEMLLCISPAIQKPVSGEYKSFCMFC